jgi:hypothetical protein
MMMPPTISSTTAGTRNRGMYPTTSRARTATAATTSRLPKDTSGMTVTPGPVAARCRFRPASRRNVLLVADRTVKRSGLWAD